MKVGKLILRLSEYKANLYLTIILIEMSYLVLAVAVLVMFGLKYFLMRKNFLQTNQRFINPRSFADEVVQNQIKKTGLDSAKKALSPQGMYEIIKANTGYLSTVDPNSNKTDNIQKLRNVCLCLEVLENQEITKENPYKQQLRAMSKKMVEVWKPWMEKNKSTRGVQGEISKYLMYLERHFI